MKNEKKRSEFIKPYKSLDPLRLLCLISENCDSLFILLKETILKVFEYGFYIEIKEISFQWTVYIFEI